VVNSYWHYCSRPLSLFALFFADFYFSISISAISNVCSFATEAGENSMFHRIHKSGFGFTNKADSMEENWIYQTAFSFDKWVTL